MFNPPYLDKIFLFLSIYIVTSYGQIIFKEIPLSKNLLTNIEYLENSSIRMVESLNGDWMVYSPEDEKREKTKIKVPSFFEGTANLIFEKTFNLTAQQISQHNFEIRFLGVSYSADISINGYMIYRHTGGEFPFSFILPKDLLTADKPNTITLNVNSGLNNFSTIPLKHGFLSSKYYGGIFRDVVLVFLPNFYLSNLELTSSLNSNLQKGIVTTSFTLSNKEYSQTPDSLLAPDEIDVVVNLSPKGSTSNSLTVKKSFKLKKGKEISGVVVAEINSPVLWNPSSPNGYFLTIRVERAGYLLDETRKEISFFRFSERDDTLLLNNHPFKFNGVTYTPSYLNNGSMLSYSGMFEDIKSIKDLGFNAVRFTKTVPHPYLLHLCNYYGLFALVELPVDGIPENIVADELFTNRVKNYATKFFKYYGNFGSIAAFGIGNRLNINTGMFDEYIKEIGGLAKKSEKLVYITLTDIPPSQNEFIDFYGFDFLNVSVQEINEMINKAESKLGNTNVFISGAGYLSVLGGSTGSTNPYTTEAHAQFLQELLQYAEEKNFSGFFINSLRPYELNYQSIISGYKNNGIVLSGIFDLTGSVNTLTYKVVHSHLNNLETVTVPLGTKKDDSPMVFIVFGIVLALGLGFLINSGRKFREDATRALMRPYNFFADVRDIRIISGFQSTLLGLIISGVLGLSTSSIFYYNKFNILFEKIILSFGNGFLIKAISYLAWHPLESTFILTGFYFSLFIVYTFLIKLFSYFVMNKVFTRNAFYVAIWSFLPITLLLPIALMLYKILSETNFDLVVYALFGIFKIWVWYRLFKGIYVIYDTNPGKVYFYGIIILLTAFASVMFYFQQSANTIDYIIYYLEEAKLIG